MGDDVESWMRDTRAATVRSAIALTLATLAMPATTTGAGAASRLGAR
jgi:hypothetical protein